MLICEQCQEGTHLRCAFPPLRRVPQSKWFCEQCAER
ncbi:hypothetical protein RI054_02g13180 [Pseudoscourfieldia marina]